MIIEDQIRRLIRGAKRHSLLAGPQGKAARLALPHYEIALREMEAAHREWLSAFRPGAPVSGSQGEGER